MSENKYSASSLMGFLNENFSLVIIALVVFLGGFMSGSMWKENQTLKKTDNAEVKAADVEKPTMPEGPTEEDLKKMPEVTAEDHQTGAKNPKITLVEYSDYQCPFCNRFQATMNQVMEEYGDQVAWVYRHFPLSFHNNAQTLAELSECVADQYGNEKFWEFSDTFYERIAEDQTISEMSNAYDLTAELGMNKANLESCVESGKFTEKVEEQASKGREAGIAGTPGTILVTEDGEYELLSGAQPFSMIEETLKGYLE